MLLNAVTESKLFKSVTDYIGWSQLLKIELDELEQSVVNKYGLMTSEYEENYNEKSDTSMQNKVEVSPTIGQASAAFDKVLDNLRNMGLGQIKSR